jgi:hypothetical protein
VGDDFESLDGNGRATGLARPVGATLEPVQGIAYLTNGLAGVGRARERQLSLDGAVSVCLTGELAGCGVVGRFLLGARPKLIGEAPSQAGHGTSGQLTNQRTSGGEGAHDILLSPTPRRSAVGTPDAAVRRLIPSVPPTVFFGVGD